MSKSPYNTPRGNGAGWYRLEGHLAVPAGVELCGASSVPNRDEDGSSGGGTVLMSYV
jgi:hypothetical protein